MSMFKWDLVDPGPGEAVAPHQRLAWGKTVGLGAQHVVAMFGATFVFPIVMGLNANLAIMMSGIATICFLLIVKGKVPSYLGTSAAFVGGATAIYSSTARAARRPRRRHRRDPGRRRGAGAGRPGHPLPGRACRQRGAAAGRHRCRRDADRLQPGAGRHRDLHARGPVGRADHDDRRDLDGRRPARLLRPDRDLPRPDLRLRPLLALRPAVRQDLAAAAQQGRHPRPRQLDGRQGAPTGSASPDAPRTGWSATRTSPATWRRRLAHPGLLDSPSCCWCCPP